MGICHPHVELEFFSPCLSVLDVVSCTVITTHGWRTSTSARPKVGEFYSHVDYHCILICTCNICGNCSISENSNQ